MLNQNKLQEIKQVCTNKFLIPFEGYAKKLPNGDCTAYPDPGPTGLPVTIGYGSTYDDKGVPVKMGDIWTHEKSLYVKSKVLDKFIIILQKYSPKLFDEPVNRVAAVLSWLYNLGEGNYAKSTFRKRIDEKKWLDASKECIKWNKAGKAGKLVVLKGLTTRRKLEADNILNP